MTISLKDMIAELRRELRYRQIIYPSLIKRGALTEAAADRQEARLQAALGVLVSLEEIDLIQRTRNDPSGGHSSRVVTSGHDCAPCEPV